MDDRITWAGEAEHRGPEDLVEILARLAGECTECTRAACVVLERGAVQVRTIAPAPPIGPTAVRRYVALETTRLFRKNGVPLVTDAVRLQTARDHAVVWAAAAAEPLVRAALDGCEQAGLNVVAVGPAAEVLPSALSTITSPAEISFPNGTTTEVVSVGRQGVWRSRLVRGAGEAPPRWCQALGVLSDAAGRLAPAFAATRARPRLALMPPAHRAARARVERKRLLQLGAMALGVWLVAGAVWVGRTAVIASRATRALAAIAPAVDTAVALRQDLDRADQALQTIAVAETTRSRRLLLLSALTAALPDSVTLVDLEATRDGEVHVAGYAPQAAAAVAEVSRVPLLEHVALDGPVTRENVAGRGPMDRFAIAARERQ